MRLFNLPHWAPVFNSDGSAAGAGEAGDPAESTADPGAAEAEGESMGSPAADPAPDAGAAVGDPPDPAAAPAKPAAAAKPDWKDRRIAQLTARLRQQERGGAAAPAPTPAAVAPAASPDISAEVERRAAELRVQDEFNRQCNEVATAGRTAFPDFEDRVRVLQSLVTPGDSGEAAAYTELLSAAIETGEGAKLLHELGGDPDEAERLLRLSPRRMAVELTRKAAVLAAAAPTNITQAPKPITAVNNRGGSRIAIDPTDPDRSEGLTTREWMERREKQVQDKRAAR